jgi:hypothetical protein
MPCLLEVSQDFFRSLCQIGAQVTNPHSETDHYRLRLAARGHGRTEALEVLDSLPQPIFQADLRLPI